MDYKKIYDNLMTIRLSMKEERYKLKIGGFYFVGGKQKTAKGIEIPNN